MTVNNYNQFVKKTDGKDVLYHGGSSYDLEDLSFFTDYYAHAYEYGDNVNGIYVTLDNKNILHFDGNVFNKLREKYKTATAKDLMNGDAYKRTLLDNKLSPASAKIALKALKSNIPYEELAKNPQINDTLIPLMVDFASSLGRNIISFWGSDYGDYGGAMEFVVNDVSRYKTLKAEYEKLNPNVVLESIEDYSADELMDNIDISDYIDSGYVNTPVYHGSQKKFDSIKISGIGKTKDVGAFFTNSISVAATYAGDNGFIYVAKLKMTNPLVLNFDGNAWNAYNHNGSSTMWIVTHPDGTEDNYTNESDAQYSMEEGDTITTDIDTDSLWSTDDLSRFAKSNGFDGLICERVMDNHTSSEELSTVYVVFSESQIEIQMVEPVKELV